MAGRERGLKGVVMQCVLPYVISTSCGMVGRGFAGLYLTRAYCMMVGLNPGFRIGRLVWILSMAYGCLSSVQCWEEGLLILLWRFVPWGWPEMEAVGDGARVGGVDGVGDGIAGGGGGARPVEANTCGTHWPSPIEFGSLNLDDPGVCERIPDALMW